MLPPLTDSVIRTPSNPDERWLPAVDPTGVNSGLESLDGAYGSGSPPSLLILRHLLELVWLVASRSPRVNVFA
jgi:hypothetical protein